MRAVVLSACALALVLFMLLAPRVASAHGMRSAYVEVNEIGPGAATVRVRTGAGSTGEADPLAGAIQVRFGEPCRSSAAASPPASTAGEGSERSSVVECGDTLAGATVGIDGLGPVVSEAVVWVSFRDGSSMSHLLTVDAPRWQFPAADDWVGLTVQYIRLGVRHILTGADHLLFLLALVLCLRRPRAVLAAETAFTLSHSLSFSAAALGWVHVSARAAEACIALSLVLIALDVPPLAADAASPTVRLGSRPPRASSMHGAALAFAFGLVHGLGFASGLSEIGVPERGIPVALASFAVGVELGQVAFLAVVLTAVVLLARTRVLPRLSLAGAYAVGGIGAFWLIERLFVCLGPHT